MLYAVARQRPPLNPNQATKGELEASIAQLEADYKAERDRDRIFNLTRGRPSIEQLQLSVALDGSLNGDYCCDSGEDARLYSKTVYGIDEAREFFAAVLGVRPEETMVNGNSSLQLIYFAMLFAWLYGSDGEHPWRHQKDVRILCPVPGYDRHFRICEELGFIMTPIQMDEHGPDMDQVEHEVRDHQVKALLCVPRFSNPSGIVYSPETISRLARLNRRAAEDFRIIYDNAYAFHALTPTAAELPSLMEQCRQNGSQDLPLMFGSTSKITFSGSGIAAMAASTSNLQRFAGHLSATTIGPDRVNQLRHLRFLPDIQALQAHMHRHADIVAPRFELVQRRLREEFGNNDTWGRWSEPTGGYFVLFNTLPGLAREVVRLAREAGLRLTPAGATWPKGLDPHDSDIRIAPTAPEVSQLDAALSVFGICVKLATSRQALNRLVAGDDVSQAKG